MEEGKDVIKLHEIVTVTYEYKINRGVRVDDVVGLKRTVSSTITKEFDASTDAETNALKVEEKILTELALILYPFSTTRCSDSILKLNQMTRYRIENMNGNIDGSHIFVFPFVHGAFGADKIVMSDSDESPSATFEYTSQHGNTCIIHRGREGSETLTGDPGSGTASMLLGGHLQDGTPRKHARMGCCDPPNNLQFFTTVIGKDNKQSIIARDYGKDTKLFLYLRGTLVIKIKQSMDGDVITRVIIYYIVVRPEKTIRAMEKLASLDDLIGIFEPLEYNMKQLLQALDTHIAGDSTAPYPYHKTICLSNCATFNYKFPDVIKLIDTLKMHLCVHAMFCVYVMLNQHTQLPLVLPSLGEKCSATSSPFPSPLGRLNSGNGPACEYYQCTSLDRGADKDLAKQTKLVQRALETSKESLVSLLDVLNNPRDPTSTSQAKKQNTSGDMQGTKTEDGTFQVLRNTFWEHIHEPLKTVAKREKRKEGRLDWNLYGRDAEQKFCEAVYKNTPMRGWDEDARNILQHLLGFHRFQPFARYVIPPLLSLSDLSQGSEVPTYSDEQIAQMLSNCTGALKEGGGKKNKKTRKRIRKRRTKKQRKAKRKTRKRRKRKRSRK